jgi:hypothetical protein
MTTERNGWIITVWALAYGIYQYTASHNLDYFNGRIQADDEMHAIDQVAVLCGA